MPREGRMTLPEVIGAIHPLREAWGILPSEAIGPDEMTSPRRAIA